MSDADSVAAEAGIIEKVKHETNIKLSAKDTALRMHVKVHSPFKVYYDGEASSISAESATGPFDILPEHHNFITLLVRCDLIVRDGKDEQVITISGGIMHVKADDVIVFLDV